MAPVHLGCSVCGFADRRGLVEVTLKSGARFTLCGTHALMHERSTNVAATPEHARALLSERRSQARRHVYADELAEALSLAFTNDRRKASDRRATERRY